MNKKISLGAAIAFMAIIAAATFSITMVLSMRTFNSKVNSLKERETFFAKIAEIDDIVRQNYIGFIDEKQLMNNAAAGFVKGTGDDYAAYYGATKYAAMLNDYSNESVQIGIVADKDDNGYINVAEVYPDSPAQAAGIEVGDLIVKIDDTDVTAENYNDSVAALKGEAGTKMTIVLRKGVEDTTLEMTRRFVEIPSVSNSMLQSNVGLIKIKEFNDTTPDQFSKQVDKLIDEGAQALVFDVRGVDTGALHSVCQVLDKLLPKGVLVSSTDKNGVTAMLETSDEREVKLPMVILTNGETSGEAELFAQAIKDFDKGKSVGTKTAGKGTMQKIFQLSDGSAIKITTARYNPPKSPSFDREGVKPDYEVKMSEEQTKLVQINGQDSDLQLKKAIEVAVAAIKAGGGIIEVPSDEETAVDISASQAVSSKSESSDDTSSEDASSGDESGDEEDDSSEDASSSEKASSGEGASSADESSSGDQSSS